MTYEFSAEQRSLNLSECGRLCTTWPPQTMDLAARAGWQGLSGEPLKASLGTAINMLILSIGVRNGVEPGAMSVWLPSLRNETLLRLGEDPEHWMFAGDDKTQFFRALYGDRSSIRPFIARLLGCCQHTTARQLRFHSQSDVELISNSDFEMSQTLRPSRFNIDASDLAAQVLRQCGTSLFYVRIKAPIAY